MKHLPCLAVTARGVLALGVLALAAAIGGARAQDASSCDKAAQVFAQGEAYAAAPAGGLDRIVSADPAQLARAKQVYTRLPPPGDAPDADSFVFCRFGGAGPTALVFLQGGKPACAYIITRGDGGASLAQAIFGDPS